MFFVKRAYHTTRIRINKDHQDGEFKIHRHLDRCMNPMIIIQKTFIVGMK